jgi:hypothetical protein
MGSPVVGERVEGAGNVAPSDSDRAWYYLFLILVLLIVWPWVVVWSWSEKFSSLLVTRAWAWRLLAPRGRAFSIICFAVGLGVFLVLVAGEFVVDHQDGAIAGFTSLIGNVMTDMRNIFAGQFVLSLWMAWYAAWCVSGMTGVIGFGAWGMRGVAHLIEDGRFERTEDIDAIGRAQRHAALSVASRRLLSLPADSMFIGVGVNEDHRSAWRRWQAPVPGKPERQSKAIAGCAGSWRFTRTNRKNKCWVTVPLAVAGAPASREVVLAGSGSGKTTYLMHSIRACLDANEDVVFIDGNATRDALIEIMAMALDIGCAVIFDGGEKGGGYDLGEGRIHSILALFDGPGQNTAVAFHYAALVGALEAANTVPWESVPDLINILMHPEQYPDLAPGARVTLMAPSTSVRGKTQGQAVAIQLQQRHLVTSRLERETKWRWQNVDGPRIVIVAAAGDQVESLIYVRTIIAGFNVWRQNRRPESRRCTLYVDEAGALLDNPAGIDIASHIEQVRSQNIGLVLAAQSIFSLGIQGQRILHSGCDLVAGATTDPEMIVQAAGAHKATEAGQSRDGEGGGKGGSARTQHQYIIDPDHLRSAPIGVFAIICTTPAGSPDGRVAGWIRVAPSRTSAHAISEAMDWLTQLN